MNLYYALLIALILLPLSTSLAETQQPTTGLVWIYNPDSNLVSTETDLMADLPDKSEVVGIAYSHEKPNSFIGNGRIEISGDPGVILELWAPGREIPDCSSFDIKSVIVPLNNEKYLFRDGNSKSYLGGSGFYSICDSQNGVSRLLIAGNSEEALEATVKDYLSQFNLLATKDVSYFVDDKKLNTIFVILGNQYISEAWVESYGGLTENAVYNDQLATKRQQDIENLATGGKLVVMGDVNYYLSSRLQGSFASNLFTRLLSKSGYSIEKTHIYGCSDDSASPEQGIHIASNIPVFVKDGKILAGYYSCSSGGVSTTKSDLSNYGIYFENGNKVLIAGVSSEAIDNMARMKHGYDENIIPTCSQFTCGSNNCICAGVRTCPQQKGKDLDGDGYSSENDCDDCPYDDVNVDADFECPLDQTNLDCDIDSNNDGIGDYASCAYCRNPGMKEKCDDVDNDCSGHCQADPSKSCSVSAYFGDGENGGGCESLPANKWGVQDSFCQMVDDNVNVDNSVCGGYNRCVKWTAALIGDSSDQFTEGDATVVMGGQESIQGYKINDQSSLIYLPGGVEIKEQPKDSNCYFNGAISALSSYNNITSDVAASSVHYPLKNYVSCIAPAGENVLSYYGTRDLPKQYIDSMRGDLDFQVFWNTLKKLDEFKVKSVNSQGIVAYMAPISSTLNWGTACVAKDKCSDGVDNDGEENIFETIPYAYYVMQINEIVSDDSGEGIPITNLFEMKFADVDDAQCKFKSEYSKLDSFPTPPEKPNDNMYLKNPLTNSPYCLDDDKDGFCGCVKSASQTMTADNSITIGDSGCYDTANEQFVMSKQFPDCDDNPSAIQYGLFYQLYTSEAYGWGGELNNVPFTSWNVHPFSPVNAQTCELMGYDFNCNKAGVEGYDYSLLKKGSSPFDFDLSTGREYSLAEKGSLLEQSIHSNVIPEDQDAACYYQSTWEEYSEKVYHYTVIGAIAVAGVGLTVSGVGAVAGAPMLTTAGGSLLVGAGFVGYGISIADAAICTKGLYDGPNADWSVVKEHCKNVVLDITLSSGAHVLGKIIKGKLLFSKSRKGVIPVQGSSGPLSVVGDAHPQNLVDDAEAWRFSKSGSAEKGMVEKAKNLGPEDINNINKLEGTFISQSSLSRSAERNKLSTKISTELRSDRTRYLVDDPVKMGRTLDSLENLNPKSQIGDIYPRSLMGGTYEDTIRKMQDLGYSFHVHPKLSSSDAPLNGFIDFQDKLVVIDDGFKTAANSFEFELGYSTRTLAHEVDHFRQFNDFCTHVKGVTLTKDNYLTNLVSYYRWQTEPQTMIYSEYYKKFLFLRQSTNIPGGKIKMKISPHTAGEFNSFTTHNYFIKTADDLTKNIGDRLESLSCIYDDVCFSISSAERIGIHPLSSFSYPVCPTCEEKVLESANFCGECGSKLKELAN